MSEANTGIIGKLAQTERIEISHKCVDVLCLCADGRMDEQLKEIFEERNLSFVSTSLDNFADILAGEQKQGVVVADLRNTPQASQEDVEKLLKMAESQPANVIIITNPDDSTDADPRICSVTARNTGELRQLWPRIEKAFLNRPLEGAQHSTDRIAEDTSGGKNESVITGQSDNFSEQLEMAGQVQRDFLPPRLPEIAGIKWATIFRPAQVVSGDIYDISRLDEDNVGFYIADVVGHGMPAALLTIFLKQAMVMRETLGDDYRIFTPVEVVRNVNLRMAHQHLTGFKFATCCYFVLNIKTYQLTYCRAGHPYPVLIRQGSEPDQLKSRGSLLGIFEQAEYVQGTVQLRPGDKLLLYSDGAEPFIGRFDNERGMQFRRQFLQITDLSIKQMRDELTRFISEQKVNAGEVDDVTVLGLQIENT